MTSPQERPEAKLVVKTRTPRPDELTRETFEFISAVDDYKRRHMRSFLRDEEVLQVLHALGYRPASAREGAQPSAAELEGFARARQRYRTEHGRLFPTWSEVFELLLGLGYSRRDAGRAA
jgi:hypothetical protein